MKFFVKDFFNECEEFPADLVTFTEEILKEKLLLLCSVNEISRNSFVPYPIPFIIYIIPQKIYTY